MGNQQELKPLECALSQPGEACVHRCCNNPLLCVSARVLVCACAEPSYMAEEKARLEAEGRGMRDEEGTLTRRLWLRLK